MLSGTGTDEPLGVSGWSGITATTGTGFDNDASQAMLSAVASANVDDGQIKFLGSPTTRELLAKRGLNGTGAEAGYLWANNTLAGKPAYVSGNVGTASLFAADWSRLWLLLWGQGLMLEFDPYTQFQNSIIAGRAIVFADSVVTVPGGFACSTGIT